MQFSTFMALAVATGAHFVLAEDAAHGPPIYPGRNNTGVPFNGSHPVYPTGTGRPTGIIGTGRPITKPVTTSTFSTSTCTEEEGEPTPTSISVTLPGDPITAFPTETDTVSGNLPFPTVSLPSGINTQIASSNGGEFSTFTSLPGGYGSPSSAPGGYGKPSSVASSLGSESSPPGGYGKPITVPTGKPTDKPFPLPSGGFPIHTLNHTVPFPSGTGRTHPISTGVTTHIPTGTGIFTKSTNTPPVYGKPKPTPLDTKVKRSDSDLEDVEDDCSTSSHIPKPTGIVPSGFPHHFPSGSGIAFPSGGHGHPSGVAHPTNTRIKSFETRTKTKSASETHSKTKEPVPTVY